MRAHASSVYPDQDSIRPRAAQATIRRAELAIKESARTRQGVQRRSSNHALLNNRQSDELKTRVASPQLVKMRSDTLLAASPEGSSPRLLASTRARTRSHATLLDLHQKHAPHQLTFLPVPPSEPASKFSNSTTAGSFTTQTNQKQHFPLLGSLLKTPSRINLRKKASRIDNKPAQQDETKSPAKKPFAFLQKASPRSSNTSQQPKLSSSQGTIASLSTHTRTSRKSNKWTDKIKAAFGRSKTSTQSSLEESSPTGVIQIAERVSFSVQRPRIGTIQSTQSDLPVFRESIESGRFSDAPSDIYAYQRAGTRYTDRAELQRIDERPLSIDSLLTNKSSSPAPLGRRDLYPCSSAPDRDAQGLPIKNASFATPAKTSPKKAALGPEEMINVIAADLASPPAVQRVCGATSALADLIVDFEDTMNFTATTFSQDGTGQVGVHKAAKMQISLDSLRTNASDVPDDLRLILQNTHEDDGQSDRCSSTSSEDETEANTALEMSAATFTSFEGKATTAASALRHVLLEQRMPPGPKASIASSAADYLAVERPSMGEKMFESGQALPSILSPSTTASDHDPSAATFKNHGTALSMSSVMTDDVPQSDMTNISVASLASSPCPKPKTSKVQMLTGRVAGSKRPPPAAPAFKFPAPRKQKSLSSLASVKKSHKIRQQPSIDSLFDSKLSPRYVRPLQLHNGSVPRPRPVSEMDGVVIGPDTPPPSSDEASFSFCSHSRQSSIVSTTGSFSIEQAHPVSILTGRYSHRKDISLASVHLVPDTIVEEQESSSPVFAAPPSRVSDEIRIGVASGPFDLFSDSDFPADVSPIKTVSKPVVRRIEPYVFSNAAELVEHICFNQDPSSDGAHEPRQDAVEWCRFRFAADIELSRSRELYPDTPYSKDVVDHFDSPVTVEEIASFLIDSEDQFRSSFDSGCFVDSSDCESVVQEPVEQPRPLAQSIMKRSLNRSLGVKSEPSPFTALPPRLNLRSRVQSSSNNTVPFPTARQEADRRVSKQAVDLAFLGNGRVSTRRKQQLDAARRKLEGTGRADEQRSDDDDTTRFFGLELTNTASRARVLEGKGESPAHVSSFERKRPLKQDDRKAERRRFAFSTTQIRV